LRLILKTRLQINAVDPPIDVPFGRQIALAPAVMLLAPRVLETGDGRSRQARRILADQRLLEVAGRGRAVLLAYRGLSAIVEP
jgi:hypothetical protein